jgi:hypothetical protein
MTTRLSTRSKRGVEGRPRTARRWEGRKAGQRWRREGAVQVQGPDKAKAAGQPETARESDTMTLGKTTAPVNVPRASRGKGTIRVWRGKATAEEEAKGNLSQVLHQARWSQVSKEQASFHTHSLREAAFARFYSFPLGLPLALGNGACRSTTAGTARHLEEQRCRMREAVVTQSWAIMTG